MHLLGKKLGELLMLQKERLEKIMNLLQQEKVVHTQQLSEMLNVTQKTIRMDFKKMEKANLLERVHGGAVLSTQQPASFPFLSYRQEHQYEKQLIAKKALSLLKEK